MDSERLLEEQRGGNTTDSTQDGDESDSSTSSSSSSIIFREGQQEQESIAENVGVDATIVIVGGGPVGLTFAILMREYSKLHGKKFKIQVLFYR